MDEGAHAPLQERRGQRVSPRVAHDEQVMGGLGIRLIARQRQTADTFQAREVAPGQRAPPFRPFLEMAEADAQADAVIAAVRAVAGTLP